MSSDPSESAETRSTPQIAYWLCIALLAVLLGTCYFTGLEYHPGYSGSAIQVLEPGSFQRDEFMSPNRVQVLNLHYKVLVPLVGKIWLDDRFLLLLNCLMALAGLIAMDRIFVAMGMTSLVQRMIVMTLFCIYHPMLNNFAFLTSPFESSNPTAVAKPFSIWMVYFAFANRKPWKWILLGLLLAGISGRAAWTPWLLCIVLYTGRFSPKVQWTLYGSAAIAGIASLVAIRFLMAPSNGDWDPLWAATLARETSELDPFWDLARGNWLGTVLFLAMCIACLRIRLFNVAAQVQVRRMAALAIVVWFLGGAYYNWAPHLVQIPGIALFAACRGLWVPNVMAYGALATWALYERSRIGVVGTVAALMLLMAYPVHAKQLALLVALLAVVAAAWAILRSERVGARLIPDASPLGPLRKVAFAAPAEFLLLPTLLGFVILFSAFVLVTNWSSFRTLWTTGVMGNNRMTAKWIGVAEYLHQETPPDAMVLAICWARDEYSRSDYRTIPADEVRAPDDLMADGAIRTRSGRANPAPVSDAKFYTSFQRQLEIRARWKSLIRLSDAWKAHDAAGVRTQMDAIGGMPDYVVAPSEETGWIPGKLPYQPVTVIRSYTILKLQAQPKAGAN